MTFVYQHWRVFTVTGARRNSPRLDRLGNTERAVPASASDIAGTTVTNWTEVEERIITSAVNYNRILLTIASTNSQSGRGLSGHHDLGISAAAANVTRTAGAN